MREDVLELILANFALPRERLGDFRAQIAANRLGERRIGELIGRHGLATVRAACAEALAYGERKIRAAIAALPDGEYRFADAMDGDGVGPEPIPIAVTIAKRGEAIALDFAGSGPQCAGDINVVYFALLATVYYALKAVLDPTVPANGGFYRAISVTAPPREHRQCPAARPGGVAHPDLPAIADVVFGALAQVVPARVPAAGNGANSAFVFSGTDPRPGRLYVYLETLAGGAGGSRRRTAWTPCRCTSPTHPTCRSRPSRPSTRCSSRSTRWRRAAGGPAAIAAVSASGAPSRCATTRLACSAPPSARAWRPGASAAASPEAGPGSC